MGKNVKETIETIVNVGKGVVTTTYNAIQWIIDHWYVILIVGAIIGILILLEITGLGGVMRALLKGFCCGLIKFIMQVSGQSKRADKEDKQALIVNRKHCKALTGSRTPQK